MIYLLDVNLLLYASFERFPNHGPAKAWFERLMLGADRVALPAVTLLGFIRLSCQARFIQPPLTLEEAVDQVRSWLDYPQIYVPHPIPGHFERLGFFMGVLHGPLKDRVTDAHLAALAQEQQATLCSHDGGFQAIIAHVKVLDPISLP